MATTSAFPLTMTPSATVSRGRAVKLTGELTVAHATAGDDVVGVSAARADTTETVSIFPLTMPETVKMEAGGSITVNTRVYAGADGKAVSTPVGKFLGTALTGASNGDFFPVLLGIDLTARGNKDTFRVFDDFTHYTDGDDWTLTASDAGSAAVGDAKGGVLSLDTSDATVADNDESYFHTTNEVFLPVAGEDLVIEARVKLAEAATDDANIVFGLSDTVAANFLQNNGAGPAASYDGIVFFKVDGGTVWQAETSNAADQNTDTNVGAFTSDTWTVLRAEVTSNTGDTTATVNFYVDGVLGGSETLTFSGLEEMHVVFGVKAGSAAEETLQIDYVDVTQEINR